MPVAESPPRLLARSQPLIGVVHLPPLPGFAGSPGLDAVVAHAMSDARALAAGGLDAVLIENEHDRPHEVTASAGTVAAMTRVTAEVVRAGLPAAVGVEILLNDPRASLAVAAASGADFIRTDYFVDRMVRSEYGEMAIDPESLLRYRESIGAAHVAICADIQVKYAAMVEPRPLGESAAEARRCGADAIVVTGGRTGEAPAVDDLAAARAAAGDVPVLVGSGLTEANAASLLAIASGAIVGSSLQASYAETGSGRIAGDRDAPIDSRRYGRVNPVTVERVVAACRRARG